MTEEYLKARKAAEKESRASAAKGGSPYLPALDDILPGNDTMTRKPLGLMEIPIELIEGTKTSARQNSFAPDFMPLLEPDTEFAAKWSNLYRSQMEEGLKTPIKVYEYLHRFYVEEGNKRVSVSRFLEMPTILADVTRIIPLKEVLEENPSYTEFLDFYRVCPIYDIECSMPGAYAEIAKLLGRDIGKDAQVWPSDLVRSLQTIYWRFARILGELGAKVPHMSSGDAFVTYLRIYTRDIFDHKADRELDKRIRDIRKELLTAANDDNVALMESSDDALKAASLITRIGKAIPAFQYSQRKPLKAAFIYDKDPDGSNWVYNHESGRKRAEARFGGLVRTRAFAAVGSRENEGGMVEYCDDAFSAVKSAADWGAEVVFTVSPRLMDDTLRAAIEYKDIIFLNCSVNLAHQAVRTYYAKQYEAKFLAGVIAGIHSAKDGTHKIGYCSDYPIYGTIASINAFAIGAAMTDPEVRIYLDWSGRRDNNWWWSMIDKGIHVISAIDSTHNKDGSKAYGVCYVERCEPGKGNDLSGSCMITNLASPIWKWGRLYEIILRTVLDGSYHSGLVDKKDQATNYWWGMISGVVDIEVSDALPYSVKRLVQILRNNILSGAMNPFDAELRSQGGLIRHDSDKVLTSKDIITMNWLNENIIGEIPKEEALDDEARETVSISGVEGTN